MKDMLNMANQFLVLVEELVKSHKELVKSVKELTKEVRNASPHKFHTLDSTGPK